MEMEILGISTFEEGRFTGLTSGGTIYNCCVDNMINWDVLYDHLTTPIDVEVLDKLSPIEVNGMSYPSILVKI